MAEKGRGGSQCRTSGESWVVPVFKHKMNVQDCVINNDHINETYREGVGEGNGLPIAGHY